MFQVYQSPQFFAQQTVKYFIERFQGSHVVVVDCNDAKSDKGVFTMALRMALAEKGMTCSITNLSNSGEYFSKAFSRQKPNVVVLNTGRSPELNTVIAKLDQLKMDQPGVKSHSSDIQTGLCMQNTILTSSASMTHTYPHISIITHSHHPHSHSRGNTD